MFLLKANTVIQVERPVSRSDWFEMDRWMPYTTKEDKLYDKHEVWDIIALHNGREMPYWAEHDILAHGKTVIHKNGKYALVNPDDLQFLD